MCTKSCPQWGPPPRELTTPQVLPGDSAGFCAWWFLQGFGALPRTKTTTPRPSLTRDPSQQAKIFAQKMAKASKLEWVGGHNPFSPFALGVVAFHRLTLVHTRVRYTEYRVLMWLTCGPLPR